MNNSVNVAVVIPCYKVTAHILSVIAGVGTECIRIYVVDDCCPDDSGNFVENNNKDTRVKVIYNDINKGVGGAVMLGYKQALADGMDIIVKVDGDGQMDPSLISGFIKPIINGQADYTKGNRFYDLEKIRAMPRMRIFGNAVLSFLTKASSGYWDLFDPTNGFTAIHRNVASQLPFERISERYFFETDMLFRLNIIRAVVLDIPMDAKYEGEESNLKIRDILGDFLYKHCRNFSKRVFYSYFLRDFNIASIELLLGVLFMLFGSIWGSVSWYDSVQSQVEASTGTVMIAVLPIMMGFQLLLSAINFDVMNVPKPKR